MFARKRLWGLALAPCFATSFAGCAIPPDGPQAPALEQFVSEWNAAHGRADGASPQLQLASFDRPAGADGTALHTSQWFQAQRQAAGYERALAAWQADNVGDCREELHTLLREKPDHREGLMLMAQLEMLERRPMEAYAPLKAFCAAHPQDDALQHMLGLVCESLGYKDEALAQYRIAAKLQPENLAYEASVNGVLNPDVPMLIPDEVTPESQPGPAPGDRLAQSGTVRILSGDADPSSLTLASATASSIIPTSASATSSDVPLRTPRTRVVDDYSNTSNQSGDLLAASQAALGTGINHEPARLSAISADSFRTARSVPDMFAGSKTSPAGVESGQLRTENVTAPAGTTARSSAPTHPAQAAGNNSGRVIQTSAQVPVSADGASAAEREEAILRQAVEMIRDANPTGGKRLLEQHAELERSARFFRIYGMAQYEMGEPKGAVASLSRSLSLDDSSALSYFLMGAALNQMGRAADAEPYFQQAARLDPRFAQSAESKTPDGLVRQN